MSDIRDEVRAVVGRTRDLNPNQRLLLAFYATLPAGRTGTQQTGQALAEEMGWAPTVFSRIRKELVEAGWLDEYDRFNNVRYFRLSDHALGRRPKVVRLRNVG
ncbi:replication initiation protein, RepL2 [Kitasatospora sp. NPDC058406]|uniref:replication initiation protein, RepL2 n=1 Tax=Kitasatospora sp. NPDC058406 TaxID=3346483 RepID=UPI00365F1F9C